MYLYTYTYSLIKYLPTYLIIRYLHVRTYIPTSYFIGYLNNYLKAI
jgi:hypothetical protein